MTERDADKPVFRVEPWTHWLGGWVHRTRGLWLALGRLESKQLEDRLCGVSIDRPVYVTSLARAGTTILLEFLASHPGVVSHQYRDYPSVLTPAWWTAHLKRRAPRAAEPVERAHGDGIAITAESPEAMEEILWMGFFPQAHDPTVSNVLDAQTSHPTFERFYRDHLRKLLWARGGTRYLAKANYHITRLEYLLELFPDARFVVPVRHPVSQVGSLMRQHRRFCRGVEQEPRALDHLRRTGHFEFGPDFRPIHTGDELAAEPVAELVETDPPLGWARYYHRIFHHLAERLRASAALRRATLLVPFEQLCEHPAKTLRQVQAHGALGPHEPAIARYAPRMRRPSYYDPGLSEADQDRIWRVCETTARALGYTATRP